MSPGCTSGEGLAEGEHTFMLDGYDRRYILRLPQNYAGDTPWPLVFALHGNGGDVSYWDSQGGVRDIRAAFANEAIIVVAEAIDNQWRDYSADPSTWPARIELELTYFDTVLEEARTQLCIDDANVFSMGFSGGGSFSGVLGCRREYIRAIAVGGSVIYFEPADCVSAPAAWITIGEQESTPEREAFRDFFRDLAGCAETSMPGAPEGCVDYDGCDPQTPVTFCSHPAGHEWPAIGVDATKAFFEQFYAP
jgi:poly(3-hydroxybutyrate) depolymerase